MFKLRALFVAALAAVLCGCDASEAPVDDGAAAEAVIEGDGGDLHAPPGP